MSLTMLFVVVLLLLLGIGLFGPVYRPKCPLCQKRFERFLYMGLPIWGCRTEHEDDPEPEGLSTFGFWAYVMVLVTEYIVPYNGAVYFIPGGYLPGLFAWLFHVEHEDDDEQDKGAAG